MSTSLDLEGAGRRARAMDTGRRLLYWGLVGALLGYGLIALLGIGLPFLLLGLVLAVVGAIRLGAQSSWALLVGFGALPAFALLVDLLTVGPACPAGGRLSAGQHCAGVSGYRVPALIFGALAGAGLVIGLVAAVRSHGKSA